MNWYKKIYSSYNLRLPKEIYPQIDEITEKILDYYKNYNNNSQSSFLGKISFFNKYINNNSVSNIYINNNLFSLR